MKIRNGFVSNSSSASFIVKWKGESSDCDTAEGQLYSEDVDEQIDALFEYADEQKNDQYLWGIKQATVKRTGCFQTTFYTSMFNGIDDFGQDAIRLVAAVAMNDQLIDATVIYDH